MSYTRIYAIKKEPDYCTILIDDGGIVEMHHNGEHWVSTYFQDRCNAMFDDDMWISLADSKQYMKDWVDKTDVDKGMIKDALNWLDPFCQDENFIKIEWEQIINQIKSK